MYAAFSLLQQPHCVSVVDVAVCVAVCVAAVCVHVCTVYVAVYVCMQQTPDSHSQAPCEKMQHVVVAGPIYV